MKSITLLVLCAALSLGVAWPSASTMPDGVNPMVIRPSGATQSFDNTTAQLSPPDDITPQVTTTTTESYSVKVGSLEIGYIEVDKQSPNIWITRRTEDDLHSAGPATSLSVDELRGVAAALNKLAEHFEKEGVK